MVYKNFIFPYLLSIIFLISACENENEVLPESVLPENTQLKAAQSAPNYQLYNWMSSINGNTSLSLLSIPGTHDSGAMHEPFYSVAKCQNLNLKEQLEIGVRYLDIRCRHFHNTFEIHHGSIYQKINFDQVLEQCFTFLNNHPSETIIMSVKEEYNPEGNSRSFEATFNAYVSKNANRWYLNQKIPDLDEVRNKIVLLRRFNVASGKGIAAINWKDNALFTINNPYSTIKIQDVYKVSNNSKKWDYIVSCLNTAKSDPSANLYLNYSSAYRPKIFGIPDIRTVANTINPKLLTYFNGAPKGKYGVVISDFTSSELTGAIVASNF